MVEGIDKGGSVSGNKWTAEQIDAVLKRYANTPTVKLAEAIGRTPRSVYQKALALGLRKSDEYMRTEAAGRLDGIRGGATRFQKGHKTWNAGMKGWQAPGVERTQFRPGHQPKNTHPIGSYRLDKHGVLQQKISDAKGNNSKRWRGVHELVWIAAHGPLPAGHIVVFKKGMRTNKLEEITLDRLECISRSENMKRNSYHNYPPEIARTIQLIGALNRQINKRAKHG
jgi:hypothetical protein